MTQLIQKWLLITKTLAKMGHHERKALDIPTRYETLLVLALGKPREKVVVDTVGPSGDIKYWRDSEGIHHVPKRALDDIIVG